ncbi:hypothetical protein GCM10011504_57910 [Siccirubricoccus deserti]|uniref:Uncharacterized protein n=1 Tax=Siccirubricoccus deserti TaxID=2013562 RepID=A0A9X0R5X2_9PROT|nr:hypothetical protein [Siccirubricoccus deserti]MBC4019158.1 hypothetical protein [Siccirubricoccus deserti]GGC72865.1 hypothetical protein GCM10011504_57910 [Siccirubricoccus deserti]
MANCGLMVEAASNDAVLAILQNREPALRKALCPQQLDQGSRLKPRSKRSYDPALSQDRHYRTYRGTARDGAGDKIGDHRLSGLGDSRRRAAKGTRGHSSTGRHSCIVEEPPGRIHEGEVRTERSRGTAQQSLACSEVGIDVESKGSGERGQHGKIGPDPGIQGQSKRPRCILQTGLESTLVTGGCLPSRSSSDREGWHQYGQDKREKMRTQPRHLPHRALLNCQPALR